MGTWGTSLYENDITKDVRDDYIELLCSGKSDEEATEAMIEAYIEIFGKEDESLFWLALADTQWDYGRLQSSVKEKALFFINDLVDERWHDEGAHKETAWNETVQAVKYKIEKKQPKKKNVLKRQSFHCQWPLGAVFAYRFFSDYSKEKGFWGKIVVFRKVSEDVWYPKHVVPVVNFYRWVGNNFPSIEEVNHFDKLPVYSPQETDRRRRNDSNIYNIDLVAESDKDIPIDSLYCLGCIKGDDLKVFQGFDFWTGYSIANWESTKGNWKIEKKLINLLIEWNVPFCK